MSDTQGQDSTPQDPTPTTPPPEPQDWRSQIPEDLRNDPTIQNTKDIAGLASQLVNAQKMLGNAIRIPSQEAGEEDWERFYSRLEQVPGVARLPADPSQDPEGVAAVLHKLGVPESPDQYRVTLPEGVDAGDPWVQQQLTLMHELGVTHHGAQRYVDAAISGLQEHHQAVQSQQRALEQALNEKFGEGLEKVQFEARAIAAQLGGDEFAQQLDEGGFFAHPGWLDFFRSTATLAKESGVRLPESPRGSGMTPDEAAARIREMQNNRDHPYWNKGHPDHRRAVETFLELHRIKRAGQQG